MATRTRELKVVITGDATALDRAFTRAGGSLDKFQTKSQQRTAAIGKAFTVMGAAAAGAAVVGLKASADAAIEAEKSQVALVTQLKAAGIAYGEHAKQIDEVIQKTSQLSGLDDEDLQDAFTNIVRVTKDVDQSLRLVGLAADFARAKHLDVAKAGEIVAKVAGGNTGILSRYGIAIDKGASSTEALAQLQARFAGQAQAYGETTAGAQDRWRVATENLQEAIGGGLLPVMTRAAEVASDGINWLERHKAVAIVLGGTLGTLGTAIVAVSAAQKIAATATGIHTAAVWANNIALRANPFVAAATALVALGVALVVAYKKSETFRNVVGGAFRAVRSVVSAVVRFIIDRLDDLLGMIEGTIRIAAKVPIIGDKFKGIADKVAGARAGLQRFKDKLNEIPSSKSVDIRVKIRFNGQTFDIGPEDKLGSKPRPGFKGTGAGMAIGKAIDDEVAKRGLSFSHRLPAFNPAIGNRSAKGVDSFTPIAGRFGLAMTSAFRPGDPGWHGKNRARDYSNGVATAQELAFARYMESNFGGKLLELIHTPLGHGIKNGQRVPLSFWGASVNANHFDHVHVAFRHGGRHSERLTAPIIMAAEEAPRFPEYFISTNPRDRDRSVGLFADLGKELGVPGFKRGAKVLDFRNLPLPDGTYTELEKGIIELFQSRIDLAELTAGTGDDITANDALEKLLAALLAERQAKGAGGQQISTIAGALGSVRSSLRTLRDDAAPASDSSVPEDRSGELIDAMNGLRAQLAENNAAASAIAGTVHEAAIKALAYHVDGYVTAGWNQRRQSAGNGTGTNY